MREGYKTFTIQCTNVTIGGCSPTEDLILKVNLYRDNVFIRTALEKTVNMNFFLTFHAIPEEERLSYEVSLDEEDCDVYLEVLPKSCNGQTIFKSKEKLVPIELEGVFAIQSNSSIIKVETNGDKTIIKYTSEQTDDANKLIRDLYLALFRVNVKAYNKPLLFSYRKSQEKDIAENTELYLNDRLVFKFTDFKYENHFDEIFRNLNINLLAFDVENTLTLKYKGNVIHSGTHKIICQKDEPVVAELLNSIDIESASIFPATRFNSNVTDNTNFNINYKTCNNCIRDNSDLENVVLKLNSTPKNNKFYTEQQIRNEGVKVYIQDISTNEKEELTIIKGNYLSQNISFKEIKDKTGLNLLTTGNWKILFEFRDENYSTFNIITNTSEIHTIFTLEVTHDKNKENQPSNVMGVLKNNLHNECGDIIHSEAYTYEYSYKVQQNDSMSVDGWEDVDTSTFDFMWTLSPYLEPNGNTAFYLDVDYSKLTKAMFRVICTIKIKNVCGKEYNVVSERGNLFNS